MKEDLALTSGAHSLTQELRYLKKLFQCYMISVVECGGQEHGLDSVACYLCAMLIDLTRPQFFFCKIRKITPTICFFKVL